MKEHPDVSERTLVLVKPDGVRRGLVGEVIGRLERKGVTLVAVELRTLERSLAEEHYGEHRDKPFFGELVDFITSGPLVALVAEGPRVVEAWRTTTAHAVLVSNEVGSGVHPATAVGRSFRDALGTLNARLAAVSDEVWLVTAGIPRRLS